MADQHNHHQYGTGGGWLSPAKIALYVFLGIAAFFLFTQHRAHLAGILPYLLLIACPLLHLFMHGGHGSNGGNQK